jgi:thiamine-phosphate pyrophosphorylase
MKLIVISSSTHLENEAQIVTKLFEAGLETFHLRKLKWSTQKMKEFINQIPEHFHDRIYIHSHHNLVNKFSLGGIHLTSTHKKRKLQTWLMIKWIKLKQPHLKITTSFKTIGNLLDTKYNYDYAYVFLSPVFDNVSSKFQSGFTEHSLNSALKKTKLNVIARGGVDVTSIEKANKTNFKGLAFYSSIWKTNNPIVEFNRVIEKFQELNIHIES